MWELDCEEGSEPKNWCFWTVVLEKTLESPLGYKEIKPVNPKGNQSWIFTETTDAEILTEMIEARILWSPDAKNWLIGKDPDAGKDWRQEEKGMTEDEMVGWHHRLDGHEFEQAPGGDDGQGSLASCSPWGHRVRHDWATEVNWWQSCSIQTVWYGHKIGRKDQQSRMENPEINPCIYSQPIFDLAAKNVQQRKYRFSNTWCWEN